MGTLAMMAGLGAFFAALIASRRIKERAFSALTDEQKLQLLDSFSGWTTLQLIPLAVLVLLYLGVSQLAPDSSTTVTVVFWLGLLIFAASSVGLNTLRLRRLPLPAGYTRSWLLSRALVFGGVVAMVAGLLLAGPR